MNVAVTTQPKRKPSFSDWLKTLTFYELLVGMKATLTHLLNYKPITLQYPHEKRLLPDNYRGMLVLVGPHGERVRDALLERGLKAREADNTREERP